jgi:predicted nucleotidyltransferase
MMAIQNLNDLAPFREAILKLAQEHKASNVRVFGSVARGEAKTGSDVDLLVRFGDDVSLLDRAALWLDLQDLLACDVDLIDDRAIKPRMKASILKDAVAL